MVKKQLKKAGRGRQASTKSQRTTQKQQYYSFGNFIGDY